jgi:hypothetical protein
MKHYLMIAMLLKCPPSNHSTRQRIQAFELQEQNDKMTRRRNLKLASSCKLRALSSSLRLPAWCPRLCTAIAFCWAIPRARSIVILSLFLSFSLLQQITRATPEREQISKSACASAESDDRPLARTSFAHTSPQALHSVRGPDQLGNQRRMDLREYLKRTQWPLSPLRRRSRMTHAAHGSLAICRLGLMISASTRDTL